MEILQTHQEVVQKRIDVQRGQRDIRSAQLLEIRITDLHDHVQLIKPGRQGAIKHAKQHGEAWAKHSEAW